MSNYIMFEKVTKDVLDSIVIGDLIKVNNWRKPMRVVGVSSNYVAMIQKQFGDTYYSVIEKKIRTLGDHNNMVEGYYHCSTDDMIFGDVNFDYNFDNKESVNSYLGRFESGVLNLSERNGICINRIQIKH